MESKFKVGDRVILQRFESVKNGAQWQPWLEQYVKTTAVISGLYNDKTALVSQWRWPLSALLPYIEEGSKEHAYQLLLDFAIDFVNKVESGRAKSVDSYAKAKAAITAALGINGEDGE